MPLLYGAINLGLFGALLICMRIVVKTPALLRRFTDSTETLNERISVIWALLSILGPLLVWLGFLGVWLPQERLTLKTGPVGARLRVVVRRPLGEIHGRRHKDTVNYQSQRPI
jgi:hypothetical protein